MSDERASHTVSTTRWGAVFSFAIVGILFVVGLSLPQQSEAGAALPKPLLFDSPIGNPVLTIDKTADNAAPQPGNIVNYTLSYANTASGSQAFNVRLYDFLPAGVQYLSASPAPVSSGDGILLFTAPSVGPTTTPSTINVQVRVLSGHASLLNQALVTADGVTPATDALLLSTVPATDHLRLTKDGDAATLSGDEVEYTLRIRNTGPVAYHNIELIDVLPTGVTLVNATVPPVEITLPLLKWAVGTLAPGALWEVTLVTTAPANVGVITNTVSLHAPTHTSAEAMWATQVISEGVILRVDKTGSAATVTHGDPLIYTLTYQNKGNVEASGVVLTDTLPANVIPVSAAPMPTDDTGQQWVWEIGTLAVGATETIVITTTVGQNAQGMLYNHVAISAPGAFGDSDDLYTPVEQRNIYLPLILRAYAP